MKPERCYGKSQEKEFLDNEKKHRDHGTAESSQCFRLRKEASFAGESWGEVGAREWDTIGSQGRTEARSMQGHQGKVKDLGLFSKSNVKI